MAKPSKFASMSVEALIRMRDDIGAALSRKADALKKELASLGADYAEVGRIAVYGKKKRARSRGARCQSSTGIRPATPGPGVGLNPAG